MRAATLLDEPVVLARLNGDLAALQDLCRHFQAQLSLSKITTVAGAGDCVMCPYHGWGYAASGQCVQIPQLLQKHSIPSDARVPRYHVAERYGLIWACLDETPYYPIPHIPSLDDPAFLTGPLRTYPAWRAAAPRVIMAALDDTHGPWVHSGLVGNRSHPQPPDHSVRRDGQLLLVDIRMLQPQNATIRAKGGHANGVDTALPVVNLRTTVAIPNLIHFMIHAEGSEQRT